MGGRLRSHRRDCRAQRVTPGEGAVAAGEGGGIRCERRHKGAMDADRLVVPIPPSDNHAYVSSVATGYREVAAHAVAVPIVRRIRTRANREYQEQAGWLAVDWKKRTRWSTPPAGRKVVMRYWVWWPDARRRDPSNLLKVLDDTFQGVLYEDDRTLLPQAMDYHIDRKNPRVEIELEVLPN